MFECTVLDMLNADRGCCMQGFIFTWLIGYSALLGMPLIQAEMHVHRQA